MTYHKKRICRKCKHYIAFKRVRVFEKMKPDENNTCKMFVEDNPYSQDHNKKAGVSEV